MVVQGQLDHTSGTDSRATPRQLVRVPGVTSDTCVKVLQ
jgi:hypothetical protein